MLPPKLLLFSLTLSKLIIHLDAKRCPKGQGLKQGRCSPCPPGYYQPEENHSSCKPCTKCGQPYQSSVKEPCTQESNTRCQCQPGFFPLEKDFTWCYCAVGFGLSGSEVKECVKCRDGYFNNQNDSSCQKWSECKLGVRSPGSTTTDVICKDSSDGAVTVNILTRLTSLRPREASQTWSTSTTTTATTASPQHTGTTERTEAPSTSPDTGTYIGMALLMFGIAGLLTLTSVTCKLHISPCLQEAMPRPYNDSCRRPVEESGDGSLSILKQNAEEP